MSPHQGIKQRMLKNVTEVATTVCGVVLLIKGDKYLISISGCGVELLIKGDKYLNKYKWVWCSTSYQRR